jgi:hypothetical protein
LDGFIITAGNASSTGDEGDGGGMYNKNGSPTLANLIFSGNRAGMYGFAALRSILFLAARQINWIEGWAQVLSRISLNT